jgi:amino acid adenylation domain-containing protein
MSTVTVLDDYLRRAAADGPAGNGLKEAGGESLTYRELDRLADRVSEYLVRQGVKRGDRVGLCLRKSIDAIGILFGVLRAGAAYVPVDPAAPARRNGFIFHDCEVHTVFVDSRQLSSLEDELRELGRLPNLVALEEIGGGESLRRLPTAEAATDAESREPADAAPMATRDDLAYILYTSGSTGKPKGVMLSHRNAVSFVEWTSRTFEPTAADRFSSHAPLHFDLSILDLYVAVKHAATLVLIGEKLGKDPQTLAGVIAAERLTIWYSAPSILSLLAQFGKLESHDLSALRLVLFAGEVFPVKHLRRLVDLLPGRRYANLYGPTETNVCTWHEIPPEIPAGRVDPFPIGRACDHCRALVVGDDGRGVGAGEEGELCISGPSVMSGYWNLPDRTRDSFLESGVERWYRTGDVVVEEEDGVYTFVGRRDRMVKRRGYRIELGEIESILYGNPILSEVAVVASSDDEGVRIKAFISTHDGSRPSVIALKRFCADNLPLYMVPDEFSFQARLPRTSTDKVDYQRLKEIE